MWLAVWLPAYWRVWGWANFLHLCDVTVILTCVGLWFGNSLLLLGYHFLPSATFERIPRWTE